MNRRIAIVCALLLVVVLPVRAYDFRVRLNSGDSLFFSIVDAANRKVAVVAPKESGTNRYQGHQQPTGAIIIPSEVEHNGLKYRVTAIGERAFAGCTRLQLVTMPETVEEIGAYAFYGCTGLKGRVTIGVNVKSVGASAFYGCTFVTEVNFRARECETMGGSMSMTVFGNCRNLRKVLVDEGVRRIPDYAFCGLDALSDSVDLPETLLSIGDYAFAYCSGMVDNLEIPDGVETIGDCAYHQCHALKSVTIGRSVKSIGGRAFYHCIGMKRVRVRSLTPAEITLTTFAELPKTAKIWVPCVSRKRYESAPYWKKAAAMESYGGCTFSIKGTMADSAAGMVLGGGDYGYGDSVSLMAVCAAGYGFDGWSDGNRENPRRVLSTMDMEFTALTQPSGIVTIVDTIYQVDTVYAEGYKVIHDTVDFVEHSQSINELEEVTFDSEKKRLKWNFPKQKERVVNVSLYTQTGSCIYSGDGRKGSVNMKRLPSGSYLVRIETDKRVLRFRLFMNAARD